MQLEVGPLNDSREKVLEDFGEEFNEICEYGECKEERTHLLACPICPAVENLCESHAEMAKNALPKERIYFDKSCLHHVPLMSCGKIRVRN
jgi:hypothetical protein